MTPVCPTCGYVGLGSHDCHPDRVHDLEKRVVRLEAQVLDLQRQLRQVAGFDKPFIAAPEDP